MASKFEVWASKDIRRRRVDICMVSASGEGVAAALPVVMHTVGPSDTVNPFLSLSFEEATVFMDELWGAGIRPSHTGSTGEVAAINRHLEDMRSLVFKTKR